MPKKQTKTKKKRIRMKIREHIPRIVMEVAKTLKIKREQVNKAIKFCWFSL